MISNLPPGVTESMLDDDGFMEKVVDWYESDDCDHELRKFCKEYDGLTEDEQEQVQEAYKHTLEYKREYLEEGI